MHAVIKCNKVAFQAKRSFAETSCELKLWVKVLGEPSYGLKNVSQMSR
jgi:hypothetical protein